MSEYLEGLGHEASMGDVFHDLYGRAEALINELDQRRIEGREDYSGGDIPGTRLRLNWGMARGEPAGTYASTDVAAVNGMDHTRLLSRTQFRLEDQIPRRVGVGGSRGNELGNDYRVRQEDDGGPIQVRLNVLGFWQTGQKPPEYEPKGESHTKPDEKIRNIMGVDRHRLVIVSQGILDNVTAIEWIRDGQAPQEVFEAMGRPQRERIGY